MRARLGDETYELNVVQAEPDGTFVIQIGAETTAGTWSEGGDREYELRSEGRMTNALVADHPRGRLVFISGRTYLVEDAERGRRAARGSGGGGAESGIVSPPMPATVSKILVEVGREVERGTPLLVVTAMKMEHTLTAPRKGRVVAVNASVDAQVMPGDELVVIA
ncbi:MAG: biotin/lipoyl-binding protein [Candidatus Schekmanbacteria bacterium]|nr:biotin/lipoyl-binding protein [Candidatus Schekmanbacteria bacterium]